MENPAITDLYISFYTCILVRLQNFRSWLGIYKYKLAMRNISLTTVSTKKVLNFSLFLKYNRKMVFGTICKIWLSFIFSLQPFRIIIWNILFLKVDIDSEYDLVQLIGEGWVSRVYLAGKVGKTINYKVLAWSSVTFYMSLWEHDIWHKLRQRPLKAPNLCLQL